MGNIKKHLFPIAQTEILKIEKAGEGNNMPVQCTDAPPIPRFNICSARKKKLNGTECMTKKTPFWLQNNQKRNLQI